MSPIRYAAPTTLHSALDLMAAQGAGAQAFCGGTDLIVQLREGRRDARLLVDIKQVPELNLLQVDLVSGARLGAAVPCCRVAEHKNLKRMFPALADAASLIGGTQIQSRASVGGNLCNASPAADTIPALIVHDAICQVAGPEGKRQIPVRDFCIAPGKTMLEPGELLTELILPAPGSPSGSAYLRFIPRNEMDIAVAGAAVWVCLNPRGDKIVTGRVALSAVAPTPLAVPDAPDLLANVPVQAGGSSEAVMQQVAQAARQACEPISDMRGTADQRRHLAAVLTRRALTIAIHRARSASPGPGDGT